MLYILLFFVALEICLRMFRKAVGFQSVMSVKRFGDFRWIIKSSAQPKAADPALGFINSPDTEGSVSVRHPNVDLSHHYSWKHDEIGNRVTSAEIKPKDSRPVIGVYGCSLTYGYYVSDHETFPWKMQELLPEYQILNYGVPAYSLLQILMKLESSIERDRPKVIVVGLHEDLVSRNTNAFHPKHYHVFRKGARPACTLRNGKLKRFPSTTFRKIPGSNRIELVFLLEYLWNKFRFYGRDRKDVMQQVNIKLLEEIRKLAERNGAKLLVGLLRPTFFYAKYCQDNGISCCDIGIDHGEKDSEGKSLWTNLPFNSHPNAKLNAEYARQITEGVQAILAEDEPYRNYNVFETSKFQSSDQPEYIYSHF